MLIDRSNRDDEDDTEFDDVPEDTTEDECDEIFVLSNNECSKGSRFESLRNMNDYKCIVTSRHGDTLNSCRAASPLVRLEEGKERCHPRHLTVGGNYEYVARSSRVTSKYDGIYTAAYRKCNTKKDKRYHNKIYFVDNMLTKYQMIKFIDFREVWFLPESVARVAAIVVDHRCHTPRH
ncbi:hypothetical protein TNCV_1704491 [Trichonephila clavipes]|nr:hypothetical protein TNCV_1704491 [Trichonephila clavipes]